jgi:hypothetical protein
VGIGVGTNIGPAAVTPDLPSAATVLHAADTAIQAAIRGGGNQVVSHSSVTRQDAAAQTLAATTT